MATATPKQIFGTAQTVIDTGVDVAAGNFSVSTTIFDNTTDAIVPYATHANAIASFPDWAAAPAANSIVELWALLQDVDGTNDDTQAPSGSTSGGARYLGSFTISADDALQRRTIVIDLRGIKKCNFYFRNQTAQNMNNDAGTNAIVKIEPFVIASIY